MDNQMQEVNLNPLAPLRTARYMDESYSQEVFQCIHSSNE